MQKANKHLQRTVSLTQYSFNMWKKHTACTSTAGEATARVERSLHHPKQGKTKRGGNNSGFWQGLLAQLDFGSGERKKLELYKNRFKKESMTFHLKVLV